MTNLAKIVAFVAALLSGNMVHCLAAESPPIVVEIESPVASTHPLQGYLRQSNHAGPSPAVVLLHSCNGDWRQLDENWGRRIASWGFAALTVDSLGSRGLKNCEGGAPKDLERDAHRALNFLARDPLVDVARVAVVGFSVGGRIALMSVEQGSLEQPPPNKFSAAVAFYPPCLGFKGSVTVPTLVLIGELDDWTLATECRNMVDGRDDWGISRQRDQGVPIKLIVYPGAYHSFDVPNLKIPIKFMGHHLEFNQSATDQSIAALREFLDATIGGREQVR